MPRVRGQSAFAGASLMHFFTKLVFAAPCSFLSAAAASHEKRYRGAMRRAAATVACGVATTKGATCAAC